jgi:putative transcriptional regulator
MEAKMIRIKLSEVLGRKKMTRKKLAELANVRPNTIGDMYNEKVRKIDLDTLDRICAVLKCNISDLLQYQDENGEK